MTVGGWLRIATVAVSLAAVQALLIDGARGGPLVHLDLPLAAVAVLVILRPDGAMVIGFVFGIAVDLFGSRLFGVHALAYCVLGSVAAAVPVGARRTRTEAIAFVVGAQAIVAITVVTGVAYLAGGSPPPDTFGRYVQATLWTLIIAVPAVSASGAHIGLTTPEPTTLAEPSTSAEWS